MLTKDEMNLYLASNRVAWQIPPGPIAKLYEGGYYMPPSGWGVLKDVKDWKVGECGELRKPNGKEQHDILKREMVGIRRESRLTSCDKNFAQWWG